MSNNKPSNKPKLIKESHTSLAGRISTGRKPNNPKPQPTNNNGAQKNNKTS